MRRPPPLGDGPDRGFATAAVGGRDRGDGHGQGEAEDRQAEDQVRRSRAELRHKAETLLLDVEDSIQTAGEGNISKTALNAIREHCDAVRVALDTNDTVALEEAVYELESASHAFARDLYQQSDS